MAKSGNDGVGVVLFFVWAIATSFALAVHPVFAFIVGIVLGLYLMHLSDVLGDEPKSGQSGTVREAIPRSVKNDVWNRDGGRCTTCGSNERLEFDHIIPLAKGGANTYRNLQLLCERCNRQKGHRI